MRSSVGRRSKLKMKFVWIFAFLPFCIGQVTDEVCMNLVSNFTSIVDGSDLSVCSKNLTGQQCCSQANEDALGMTLNNAIRNNVDLGSDLRSLQDVLNNSLNPSLYNLWLSLKDDVLRPLMNSSADFGVASAAQNFIGDLESIREDVLSNIEAAIQGDMMNVNLTGEIDRYLREGLSTFYYNATIGSSGALISADDRICFINAAYSHLFPAEEQTEIATLGNNLEQIRVAYEVARAVGSSVQTILTALDTFDVSYTCTNVWTRQYGCPRCAGQATPLCQGRCNEVLIGCMSSLQQVIVQLNVLMDFARASVSSLISGSPFNDINVNDIAGSYTGIFSTSIDGDLTGPGQQGLPLYLPEQCGRRKRSADTAIVRQKRDHDAMFPNVTINQTRVTYIQNTTLPAVVNVSLTSDRTALCNNLMADGSNPCTIGVNSTGSYTSTFTDLEISEQVDNPVGPFNLSQLRDQAAQLPYVLTSLLMDSNDTRMLYENVLPGREIPNLSFLNDTTNSTTMPTDTDPTMSPGDGGGAAAISFSLGIILVALLLAIVL